MKQLLLLAPGLSDINLTIHEQIKIHAEDFSSLDYLCSKGTCNPDHKSFLMVLSQCLGLDISTPLSIAELTAVYDGLSIGDSFWLRADPVELKADMAAVYMYGNSHLNLNLEDLSQLKSEIQDLLKAYNGLLHTPTPHRWYIELPNDPGIKTTDPQTIIGKDVLPFLPQSTGEINWQQLQTEIQMILHDNAHASGLNSLWFWGEGGKLPKFNLSNPNRIYADDALSLGLAKQANIKVFSLPSTLNNAQIWHGIFEKDSIIVYSKFQLAQNSEEFITQLKLFDEQFLKPALKALKQGKSESIQLWPFNGVKYTMKKANAYFFWQRIKKLKIWM